MTDEEDVRMLPGTSAIDLRNEDPKEAVYAGMDLSDILSLARWVPYCGP